MQTFFIGLVVALGFGGVIYGGYRLYEYLRGPVSAVSGAIAGAYDATKQTVKRAVAAVGDAVGTIADQSQQSAAEREGRQYFGPPLEVFSARNYDRDRKARLADDARAPKQDAILALRAQLDSIDKAGGEGVYVGEKYVPRAEVVARLRALGEVVPDRAPDEGYKLPAFLQGGNADANSKVLALGGV